MIWAYKGFNENFCNKGYQYKIGDFAYYDGDLNDFSGGLNAYMNIWDCLKSYDIDKRHAHVVATGNVLNMSDGLDSKFITDEMFIYRKIDTKELLDLMYESATSREQLEVINRYLRG